jgi:amino acid adenylation domain-containing protein
MNIASPVTVISRFREIAERFGGRTAIRQESSITYEELDFRSEQVAEQLSGLRPEAAPVIGLSLAQAPEAVAAMLGVMKTGRAYTIIDPGAPVKRKQAIAEEMALEVVIGDSALAPWPDFSGLCIDSTAAPADLRRDFSASESPDAACCIVQTSGTTGRPLGVEMSHAALLHTIENYAALAAIVPEDRFTMLTSPAHFAAHTAIFGALLNGACLFPFDVRSRGFQAMTDWLEQEALTIYQSPPSLFRAFIRQLPPGKLFSDLRFLRLGGEPALVSDFELFEKHFPASAQFINALGMSEAGGNVAYFRVDRDMHFTGPVLPIGRPAAGQEVFLADACGELVAPGETGEIIVRSDFLATGYYRRPELTSQRFSSSSVDGRRELRTGDLAHLTPEGRLMHDGRKDDQIKILGHRVDLAGLESVLRSFPDVREVRVLPGPQTGGTDQLLAFVVPADTKVTAGSIGLELSNRLTAPVLPKVLLLDRLPLNSGGKIDRAQLLQLAAGNSTLPSSAHARDETERQLAKIWGSVLGVGEIGVYDNFFTLGGDSLKALSVSSAVEESFGLPFSPWRLLERPTIAQSGEYLRARQNPLLTRENGEQVVALRSPQGGSEAPLFICPGGWGHEQELMVFAIMLQHLPPGVQVYGLKQNFLGSPAQVAESIDSMASNFLAEIKKIQPTGPYRLLGECVASIIVLEIAHQLELAGEAAETIILLDPRRPRAQPPDTGAEPEESSDKLRRYYQILTEATPRPCGQRVHVIGAEETEGLRQRLEQWKIFDPAQLEIIRVSGDHTTYLRGHGAELAREIARLIWSGNSKQGLASALESSEEIMPPGSSRMRGHRRR